MTHYTIKLHLEFHRDLLAEIRSRFPETKIVHGKSYMLDDVDIDVDGDVTVTYSRYVGCGDYDTHTEYSDIQKLFAETI